MQECESKLQKTITDLQNKTREYNEAVSYIEFLLV